MTHRTAEIQEEYVDVDVCLGDYDNTITTPTITNLADNAITASKFALSGMAEASNLLGNVTVKVYDGNALLGTTTTDFMGSWNFTPPTPYPIF